MRTTTRDHFYVIRDKNAHATIKILLKRHENRRIYFSTETFYMQYWYRRQRVNTTAAKKKYTHIFTGVFVLLFFFLPFILSCTCFFLSLSFVFSFDSHISLYSHRHTMIFSGRSLLQHFKVCNSQILTKYSVGRFFIYAYDFIYASRSFCSLVSFFFFSRLPLFKMF